jgi:hypothetical protein
MASEELKLKRRWHDLAGQAAKETDPEKLMQIVKDLCGLLDAQKKPPASSSARPDQSKKTTPQVASEKYSCQKIPTAISPARNKTTSMGGILPTARDWAASVGRACGLTPAARRVVPLGLAQIFYFTQRLCAGLMNSARVAG